jgi:hypothetical protein
VAISRQPGHANDDAGAPATMVRLWRGSAHDFGIARCIVRNPRRRRSSQSSLRQHPRLMPLEFRERRHSESAAPLLPGDPIYIHDDHAGNLPDARLWLTFRPIPPAPKTTTLSPTCTQKRYSSQHQRPSRPRNHSNLIETAHPRGFLTAIWQHGEVGKGRQPI